MFKRFLREGGEKRARRGFLTPLKKLTSASGVCRSCCSRLIYTLPPSSSSSPDLISCLRRSFFTWPGLLNCVGLKRGIGWQLHAPCSLKIWASAHSSSTLLLLQKSKKKKKEKKNFCVQLPAESAPSTTAFYGLA